MSKQQTRQVSYGGGSLIGAIALILMVAGFAMESTEYDVELGALLFTIGFWLFVIPLIVIGIILAIVLVAFIVASILKR